ncbi:hypothetical protein CDAR_406011 [Caerostris darwini]|uniref:Uncharacterized protein n=1 Tax=Caerostris darwini TaxID=1538125 RepID=A0AAV4TT53_9ARAC|nr:hypothetical protein CDAR_406011 [Caerostris darwini]
MKNDSAISPDRPMAKTVLPEESCSELWRHNVGVMKKPLTLCEAESPTFHQNNAPVHKDALAMGKLGWEGAHAAHRRDREEVRRVGALTRQPGFTSNAPRVVQVHFKQLNSFRLKSVQSRSGRGCSLSSPAIHGPAA